MSTLESAAAALRASDEPHAMANMSALGQAEPDLCTTYIERARRARDAGCMEDAAAALSTARTRFPDDAEPLVETGWLAHIMRTWATASAWWHAVRLHSPHHVVGFVNGAIAAREQGFLEEADALLAAAMERFPDLPDPLIEYATVAQHQQNWPEVTRRWAQVRVRFPEIPASYTGAARALREQGRHNEADSLLEEAQKRFPDDLGIVADHAWVAHIAHRWAEADRRWTALRRRAPDLPVGFTSGAISLRELGRHDEADALLTAAIVRFPSDRGVWTERAWLASARRTWPEAARRWADTRERFPDFPEAWLRGAIALAETWDYAGAEALLVEAMARFPAESALAVEYADLAMRQNRLDEAGARYGQLRERFPRLAAGHLGLALVARNSFRLDDATAILEAAQSLLPNEPRLFLEHALLPVFAPLSRNRDPEETLRRLAAIRARFPDYADGVLASIRHLRDAGQLAEAAAIAQDATQRLPANEAIVIEMAALALARGDYAAAEAAFRTACTRFPDHPGGPIGLAQVLATTGRTAEAEAALQIVIARFPNAPAAYTAFAEIAMDRHDWPAALQRWTAAHQRFPDDNSFAQRISDVRLHLAGEEGHADLAGREAETISGDPRAALRDLVMQFESLGGRGLGCEFGMFQREFGAEPLGLLRWADMPYEGLIYVLENRFEGVGLPENTEVFVNRENERPEYCTRDLRGFMFMRAFVYEDQMPIERMRKQAVARLAYLRDKLIEDLETGSKIFLWRCTERNLTDAEIDRLHRAVRSYGDNWLLYVRLQDDARPNGTVEIAGEGLMIGYIDRFKVSPDGVLSSVPASASWLELCRRAIALAVV